MTRRGILMALAAAGLTRAEGFATPAPRSRKEWEKSKSALRRTLRTLLGEWPPLFVPKPDVDRREKRDGFTLEHYTFDNGAGDKVYGYTLIPDGLKGRGPAILYNHYHGGYYKGGKEEIVTKGFSSLPVHPGEELARRGYVVNAIDAYAFGERRWQGPAGQKEEGKLTEASLFKLFLWQGRTLWGMMVRDDLLALNYLLSRPEVDPARIGTMGMSMGSTRSWWASALDDRIRCTVSVACLTHYQSLIRTGDLAQHSIYYFVPGLLKERIDMDSVVGLIAPRPHLTLTGDKDAGSPVEGVKIINGFAEQVYKACGAGDAFRGLIYPGVGHKYMPEMWKETLDWLDRWLKG